MIIDTTDGDTILEASDRLSVLAHTIFLVHLELLLFCLQRRLYKSDVFSIWPVHNDNRFLLITCTIATIHTQSCIQLPAHYITAKNHVSGQ